MEEDGHAGISRNSLMDNYVAMHMRYATSYAVQTEGDE